MLNQVRVGPTDIIIHQGNTLVVAEPSGAMSNPRRHGVFASDTRLLSKYSLLISGKPWIVATGVPLNYNRAVHYLLSPELEPRRGHVKAHALQLRLEREIGSFVIERLAITSFATHAVAFHFSMAMASDFADLFDVKSGRTVDRGDIDVSWNADRRTLRTTYRHSSFERGFAYEIDSGDVAPHYGNGQLRFRVRLEPKQTWMAICRLKPIIGSEAHGRPVQGHSLQEVDRLQESWHQSATRVAPANSDIAKMYRQAVYDIGSLRLYEHDANAEFFLPAGGVPWFVALFGRDSLITAMQSLLVGSRLARGTLHRLAKTQARERDDRRDAQPGKIVHEMRFGELARLGIVPHARYYGTADATLLYLILLSETWRWTGEESLLREHHDTALRCLEWIDRFGDIDGDGFQEYRTFSASGYHNQSWKDSGEALVYPDGSQVAQPIATCELQGYAFDAKSRMAEILSVFGDVAGRDELLGSARRLQQAFEKTFWMEDEGTYAFALDPQKRQVRSIASNPGHLLWSGIVASEERARRVVERLLAPDMYSGWGIRTLSSGHPSYNPHSYQLGSVWPHDNAIIATGARRYGMWSEANRIVEGVFAACSRFHSRRLPELFAGLNRHLEEPPVQYLEANVPQAWASGSIIMMLQCMLSLGADAPSSRLRVSPRLPAWLGEIVLSGLRVGEAEISIRFSGHGTSSVAEVTALQGKLTVDIN